jgi:hypothetical protein
MNKRALVIALIALTVVLVFGFILLKPGAVEEVSAQGLCEYGACLPFYSGWVFTSYMLNGMNEPKQTGDCMLYDIDGKYGSLAVVAMVLHDSPATALAQYMDGNVLTVNTDNSVKVCGDAMYFLGHILPVPIGTQSLLEFE